MGWESGPGSVSTLVGFGLSLFFIAYLFTRLICRRLQAAEPRPAAELDLDPMIDVEQPQRRRVGLDPALVAEIPTAKFSGDAFGTEDSQCTICLGEYEDGEVLRIMPECGHSFHRGCIDVWLRKQTTCPVCRLSLKDTTKREGVEAAAIDSSSPQQRQHPPPPPGNEDSRQGDD
ncbi:hypothetical protein SAY86_010549 [Trapa natans]|uniref:RING-type E3 ubiquitin transferase n=1 Tax=Trapa natans TaxID=22666 RepID=A0AAN7LI93_TRANT|nr:hypothetical protein SAY86_010549 [Trapa natans]